MDALVDDARFAVVSSFDDGQDFAPYLEYRLIRWLTTRWRNRDFLVWVAVKSARIAFLACSCTNRLRELLYYCELDAQR